MKPFIYLYSYMAFTAFFITACENKTEKVPINQKSEVLLGHYGDTIQLRSPLDSLLLEFVEQNHLNNIHGQLYINKVYQDTTVITIVSRQYIISESSYAEHIFAHPLFYVKIKNCVFDVYTGIEDEFDSKFIYPTYVRDTSNFIVWRVDQVNGHLKRNRVDDDIPFFR